jgi:hypothetical protein
LGNTGRLAGCSRPGGLHGDRLAEDLEFLQSTGIKALLSLTETSLDEEILAKRSVSRGSTFRWST